ncbi:MAG: hypothetical protein KTR32_15535 [Granulosicoccus sp.]|nr:hypothetical protein [Granulosicoccus sp.]
MIKLRPLFIISMIVAGMVPMGIASFTISKQASETMVDTTYQRLEADVAKRTSHVEDYINSVESQLVTMGSDPSTVDAMRSFSSSFPALARSQNEQSTDLDRIKNQLQRFYDREFLPGFRDAGGTASASQLMPRSIAGIMAQHHYLSDNSNPVGSKDNLYSHSETNTYGIHHAKFHPHIRHFLKEFGYYDIFLVEPDDGKIVYSVFKETDFGTSLFNGAHRDSNLTRATRRAMDMSEGEFAFEDFQTYVPSSNAPAAFLATPIYDKNQMIGVLAFQIPIQKITDIMGLAAGLGETGESMLVGADGLMRSQSRFSDENTILVTNIQSDAARLATSGQSGTLRETSNNTDYLKAFSSMDLGEINWGLVTRIQADEALASVNKLTLITLIVAGCSAVVVSIFALFLGTYLYRQLGGEPGDMVRIAKNISNGDLSDHPEDANRGGAYAQLVEMRGHLRNVMREANVIAQSVKSGAAELSAGNQGLSERTEQQAANLEETGSSTEELTSTVKQNASNARSANELAINTRQRASASGEVSTRAVEAMEEISSASERIADIIGVIDEIAFQTNLLALNAAVEAARAGEQGRGFAVVASEVRQLAGRSASAAKEIKELIEDSVSKVKDGTGLVAESGDELKLIVKSVTELTDIVGEITVATDEQAVGIEQINQALVHMDSVTQQNAALVEEAATTSRTMSEQAIQLTSRIGYFSVDGDSPVEQPSPGASSPAELEKSGVRRIWQSKKANNSPLEPDAANQSTAAQEPIKRAASGDEMWDEF